MMGALDPAAATPDFMKIWFDASRIIASSFDPITAELVKIRASQINGCANGINMHTVYARADGETEQHSYWNRIAVGLGGVVDPAVRAAA